MLTEKEKEINRNIDSSVVICKECNTDVCNRWIKSRDAEFCPICGNDLYRQMEDDGTIPRKRWYCRGNHQTSW